MFNERLYTLSLFNFPLEHRNFSVVSTDWCISDFLLNHDVVGLVVELNRRVSEEGRAERHYIINTRFLCEQRQAALTIVNLLQVDRWWDGSLTAIREIQNDVVEVRHNLAARRLDLTGGKLFVFIIETDETHVSDVFLVVGPGSGRQRDVREFTCKVSIMYSRPMVQIAVEIRAIHIERPLVRLIRHIAVELITGQFLLAHRDVVVICIEGVVEGSNGLVIVVSDQFTDECSVIAIRPVFAYAETNKASKVPKQVPRVCCQTEFEVVKFLVCHK